jgi:hypothetical protein
VAGYPCSSGRHRRSWVGVGEGSDDALEKISDAAGVALRQHRPGQARGTDRSLALPRGPLRDLEHHTDRSNAEPYNAPYRTE